MNIAKGLILVGIGLVVIGVLWPLGERIGLGRLPGDIIVRGRRTTFYFPVVTCLLLSILFSLLMSLFQRRAP
ncbi:DUF2905 domain-containing protein [Singulisphaera sp. Ch08]|uniref:DUF2905 domain-containing protein n=1 Tax=Singulisphaera sp. Ch08 TaxID=3120278 RepID=A0AAU7CER4_9BACT